MQAISTAHEELSPFAIQPDLAAPAQFVEAPQTRRARHGGPLPVADGDAGTAARTDDQLAAARADRSYSPGPLDQYRRPSGRHSGEYRARVAGVQSAYARFLGHAAHRRRHAGGPG